MLVLTRKVNESIRIGDDITIKVIGRRGERVRLGIEAPNHVDIVRAELTFWYDIPTMAEMDWREVSPV